MWIQTVTSPHYLQITPYLVMLSMSVWEEIWSVDYDV